MDPRKSLVRQLSDESQPSHLRYRRLFVGADSIGALLRYELLVGVLGAMPGALGYFLRSRTWPGLFGRVGRGVMFGRGLTIRCPGRIDLADDVVVDDLAVLDAKGDQSRIAIGRGVLVGRGTILTCTSSSITIGDGVSIGPYVNLASKSVIRIGAKVAIGAGAHLIAGGHASDDPTIPATDQPRASRGIVVEDGAWIGVRATILDGVTVGHNAVVAAGAVVTRDVPPLSVFVGNPGRVVRNLDRQPAERA